MSQDTLTGSASVSSSLMYNYLAATSVDAAYPLAAAEDSSGAPLLFSVGASAANTARKTLWVMARDTTVTTGWRQVELSPDATHDVQGYAVVQAPTGELVIAVALDDGAGGSHVFVSPTLTPTPDGSVWSSLGAAWVRRQGGPTGAPVQRLLLGDFVSTGEAPLLVAEVKNASGITGRYFVDASTSAVSNAWVNWAPPKDVQTLHDVVVGRASITGDSYRGTWTLYDDNTGKRCLTFTSLLDGNSTTHTLSVQAPSGARCLWALADRANNGVSALYVGGDGLWWFPSTGLKNAKSAALAIASADLLPSVSAVLAHQDSARVSVWAVDGNQRLFSVNNAVGATSGWSTPLQQREHVAHLAARRNQKRATSELFVSSTNDSLITYLWQDPDTTTWQNTDMALPALANGQEFPCYTTVVRFTDAQGAPLIGQTVQLSASEWSRPMVNGYWTDLDSHSQVQVQTDAAGTVTLINKVSDVGTPVYHFNAPFLAGTVTADPSVELRQALARKLQSGDLSTWTRPDGSPLVPPGTDPDLVQQVQASLQQLMDNMDSLPADGSPAPAASAKSVTPAPTAMARTSTSFKVLGTVENAIETAAGDVLQALKSAAGVVYEYVLQPIADGARTLLQFFVKIGEEVVTFVIRTVKEALQLISWLFDQLMVLIGDLIALLGFLFSWDDILNTQKALELMAQDAVLGLADKLRGSEASITAFFDKLIAQWDVVCADALGMQDVSPQQVIAQTKSAATPEQQAALACLTTSPGATFSSYQVAHGGVTDSTSDAPDNPVSQAIADFMRTVGSILADIASTVKEVCEGFQTMLQQGTFSLHAVVQLLAGETAKALLRSARDLLLGLCAVVADVSQALLQDVLLRPFHIPVLSWLYKKLTNEDSLTMLGALSLLTAIPLTIVYKLLTGQAPIPEDAAVPQQKQARTAQAMTPWRASPTLELDAQQDAGTVVSDLAAAYSTLGGGASTIASVLYTAFLGVGLLLKGSKKRICNTAQAVCTWVGVGGSFPNDANHLQQGLDRGLWLLSAVEAVVTGCVAYQSWQRGAEEEATGHVKELEEFDSLLLGLIGGVSLVFSLVSYVLELGGEAEDAVPYHSPFWDTEKFVANVCRFGGTTLEGAAGFLVPPVQKYAFIGAVVGESAAFALDAVRWADTVVYNVLQAEEDGKKLFQNW